MSRKYSVYDQVVQVISKTPSQRKEFEVQTLLPWFRKKSELFKNLKSDLLSDVIKHCQFITKKNNEIIIKQGDKGNCFYIALNGQVSIYIQYAKPSSDESEGETKMASDDSNDTSGGSGDEEDYSDRSVLGTYVTSLGAGATFGEVALVSEDTVRTASIISDDETDLIVVDRDLYNRSVKNVLAQEFQDKSTFVNRNPFFGTWAPKYKKQLAMALEKHTMTYDTVVTRQGAPIKGIYFILRGEVKLVMDPHMQTELTNTDVDETKERHTHEKDSFDVESGGLDVLTQSTAHAQNRQAKSPFRRKTGPKKLIDVCYLGNNESVGDFEVLMEYDNYLQTAICTQKTEMLVLEMKHYDRLFVKRNPKTIELMKQSLELRFESRFTRKVEQHLPLVRHILRRVREVNETEANKQEIKKPISADTVVDIVPPRGCLVDQQGPGTVFYKIRMRERRRKLRQQKDRHKKQSLDQGKPSTLPPQEERLYSPNMDALLEQAAKANQLGIEEEFNALGLPTFPTQTDNLDDLEDKIKRWLGPETNYRNKKRVAKLRRLEAQDLPRQPVPGVRVFVRPRRVQSAMELQQELILNDEEFDFGELSD